MMQWHDMESLKDLPVGTSVVAGYLAEDPQYVITTLMHSDYDFVITAIDPEFTDVYEPMDIVFTKYAIYKPVPHPEEEIDDEAELNMSAYISALIQDIENFFAEINYEDCQSELERAVHILDEVKEAMEDL